MHTPDQVKVLYSINHDLLLHFTYCLAVFIPSSYLPLLSYCTHKSKISSIRLIKSYLILSDMIVVVLLLNDLIWPVRNKNEQ